MFLLPPLLASSSLGATQIRDPDPADSIRFAWDFDGNGTADILWRHDSGFVITWDINHTQTGYHAIAPTNPRPLRS